MPEFMDDPTVEVKKTDCGNRLPKVDEKEAAERERPLSVMPGSFRSTTSTTVRTA